MINPKIFIAIMNALFTTFYFFIMKFFLDFYPEK